MRVMEICHTKKPPPVGYMCSHGGKFIKRGESMQGLARLCSGNSNAILMPAKLGLVL